MSAQDDAVRTEVDRMSPEGIRAGERLVAAVWDLVEVPPIRRGGIRFPVPPELSWPAAGPPDARLPRT